MRNTDGQFQIDTWMNKILLVIDRWAPFLLIVFAMIVILPGLGKSSLLDWDESIYAQVAREMVQSGNWIDLHHGYQPYFEKPPLLIWSIALCYKLFGVNEFWSRLPSAISGILLVLITYLSGRTIYGNRTGFLAGLILLSSFGFVFQSRNGTTNMPLSLFVFTGVFAYLRMRTGSQKGWYLFFAAFALAFMVKFWAALILPLVIGIVILMEGKTNEVLRTKHFWLGLLLAAVIVLPWHILAYMHYGQAFLESYITRNLVQRTLTPLEGNGGSTLYYLDVLRNYLSPWFFLIPFALTIGLRSLIDRDRKADVLFILILTTIGLYTFVVHTKLAIYILPVFPALAILIADLFILGASTSRSNSFIYLVSGSLIVTLVTQNKILILFILTGILLFFLLRLRIVASEQMPPILASLIFIGFAMVGTIGYIQGNNRLSIWQVYGVPDQPISQIAILAGQNNPSFDEPLIGYDPQDDPDRVMHTAVEGPAATFYSNRPVHVAETWEQLIELMNNQSSGEILIAENYLDHLSTEFEVTVVETVSPLVYAKFNK